MKNGVSKLRIYRTSTSPYFSADFNLREKKILETATENHQFEIVDCIPCDFLITNTHTDFSLFTKADLDNIKLIVHANSGYDNFPAKLVEDLKAEVVIGSTIRAEAVTQYILSALYHHLSPVNHQSSWSRGPGNGQSARALLSDLKVILIGHGHIGKMLKASLSAMVSQLIIIDPNENLSGDPAESDVVILACGLNFSSRHMINATFLKSLKKDALIINAARGELINTEDLIDYLKSNPHSYAVLDVYENEPADLGLFQHLPNVLTTSHIAGVFKGIDQATINFERKVINDFLTMKNFKEMYQPTILRNRIKAEGLI